MGCLNVHQQVITWLQGAVKEVVAAMEDRLRDSSYPLGKQPYTDRIRHFITVRDRQPRIANCNGYHVAE